MINLISNQDEYSRVVTRQDGTRLDFSAIRADQALIIGVTSDDDNHESIILSAQEVEELLYHLTDPSTRAVFRAL